MYSGKIAVPPGGGGIRDKIIFFQTYFRICMSVYKINFVKFVKSMKSQTKELCSRFLEGPIAISFGALKLVK
jgi:hypothetical protein